jgi:hypothetical protein
LLLNFKKLNLAKSSKERGSSIKVPFWCTLP